MVCCLPSNTKSSRRRTQGSLVVWRTGLNYRWTGIIEVIMAFQCGTCAFRSVRLTMFEAPPPAVPACAPKKLPLFWPRPRKPRLPALRRPPWPLSNDTSYVTSIGIASLQFNFRNHKSTTCLAFGIITRCSNV